MKLVLLKPYKNAGGRTLQPGQILEVDATETAKLLAEEIAEPIGTPKKTPKPKNKPKK